MSIGSLFLNLNFRICFDDQSNEFIVGADDPKIKICKLTSSSIEKIGNFDEHTSWILDTQIDPEKRYFLTSSLDCTVKLWNKNTKRSIFNFPLDQPTYACCFSPTDPFTILTTNKSK